MDTGQTEHLSPSQAQAVDALLSVENSLATVIRSATIANHADLLVRDLRALIDSAISSAIRNPKR